MSTCLQIQGGNLPLQMIEKGKFLVKCSLIQFKHTSNKDVVSVYPVVKRDSMFCGSN